MKRTIRNNIPKPNYSKLPREIHGVLRNSDGFMIFSEFRNGNVVYNLTNIKDLEITPNNIGRREFNKKWIKILEKNVIDENFTGELFMFCTHQLKQKLLPIFEFTINRANKQFHRMNNDGYPYQPYCKESKKLYQNNPGNKQRTKQQLFEGSLGSRTRALTTALKLNNNPPSLVEIFNKFGNRCFDTGKIIDIEDRNSYEIDHMMPASGYNPLNENNAVLLSKESNQRKKDYHPLKYYGLEKFKVLCDLLGVDVDKHDDENYILNDCVLNNFNENFDEVMSKWVSLNKNKKSFIKYLNKEIKRLERLDIYDKHTILIEKLKKYESTLRIT